jgi:hypothetical protein
MPTVLDSFRETRRPKILTIMANERNRSPTTDRSVMIGDQRRQQSA